MNQVTRHIPLSVNLRAETDEDGKTILGGHATVFGAPYKVGTNEYETIEQGAFRSAFEAKGNSTLPVFYQHGWAKGGHVVPVGVAQMDDSGEKMSIRATLYADISEEAAVLERAAQDEAMTEWSLGFVEKDSVKDPEHANVTIVREADPLEVSIVLRGAADTELSVRSVEWDEVRLNEEENSEESEEEVVETETEDDPAEDITIDWDTISDSNVREILRERQ